MVGCRCCCCCLARSLIGGGFRLLFSPTNHVELTSVGLTDCFGDVLLGKVQKPSTLAWVLMVEDILLIQEECLELVSNRTVGFTDECEVSLVIKEEVFVEVASCFGFKLVGKLKWKEFVFRWDEFVLLVCRGVLEINTDVNSPKGDKGVCAFVGWGFSVSDPGGVVSTNGFKGGSWHHHE